MQLNTAGLRAWSKFLADVGITPSTGWRWRKKGWINPVNIAGRLYVGEEEIVNFTRRAQGGEFAGAVACPARRQREAA